MIVAVNYFLDTVAEWMVGKGEWDSVVGLFPVDWQ